MNIASFTVILAIAAGQIVKIPLGSGGATALDITVLILCFVGLWKSKFKLIKPPAFIISALLFVFLALLSLILTPLPLSSSQYFSSFLYIIRFSGFILLGWLIISAGLPPLKQNIESILILSGISLAVLGLLQFILLPDLRFLAQFGWDPHYFRTSSTFLDPNFLGAFLVLTLLLLFKKQRSFLSLVVYLALMTTFSRSSYGMFLISFLFLSFLKRSLGVAILASFLFLFLFLAFQIQIRAVNRVLPLDRNQTASLRLSTWSQGFQIFQKSPILGVGYNSYNAALKYYKLGDDQFLQGKGATSNDSSLLHVLATTGILGALTFLLFLQTLIKAAYPKNPILIAAIFGLLAHSVFVNSLFYPFILIWIILYATNLSNGKSQQT